MGKCPTSSSTASECFCLANSVGKKITNDTLQCTKVIKLLKDLLRITIVTIDWKTDCCDYNWTHALNNDQQVGLIWLSNLSVYVTPVAPWCKPYTTRLNYPTSTYVIVTW